MNEWLRVAPEIAEAVSSGAPVVAFETTILSFGLPRPLNEEVGALCEQTAREVGAVPATLALLDGQVCIGLNEQERALFCSGCSEIVKVNLQNFAAVLATKRPGALTVAASLRACAMAGIRVFATGGIGGVHRGFAESLDISSDVRALAEAPVVAVSAGAKSILDVGATLEVLETLGVPVVGYRTGYFPLFFSAQSPYALECRCETPEEVARLARAHFACGSGGMLVVTPVPESDSIPQDELEAWTERALREAAQQGVSGKAVTPFLLSRLEVLSGGRTLAANRALIANNARVAAEIACALADSPSARASKHPAHSRDI